MDKMNVFIIPNHDRSKHEKENDVLNNLTKYRCLVNTIDGEIRKSDGFPYYYCWSSDLNIKMKQLVSVMDIDEREREEAKFVEALVLLLGNITELGNDDNILAAVHFGCSTYQKYRELVNHINGKIVKNTYKYGSLKVTYYSSTDSANPFSLNRYDYKTLFLDNVSKDVRIGEFQKFIEFLKSRGRGEEESYFDERMNLAQLHSAILPIMIDFAGLKAVYNRRLGSAEKMKEYLEDSIKTIKAVNIEEAKDLLKRGDRYLNRIAPDYQILMNTLEAVRYHQLTIQMVGDVLDKYDALWRKWRELDH